MLKNSWAVYVYFNLQRVSVHDWHMIGRWMWIIIGCMNRIMLMLLVMLALVTTVEGQELLRDRIDTEIGLNPVTDDGSQSICTDFEFIRRVYIDVTGRHPTAEAVVTFVSDQSQKKREQLIDQLLSSPEHARRLQHHFDVMLLQRLPKKQIELANWQQYLFESMHSNKPWNQLVHELLTVDGTDAATRPAARFILARELKREETVRAIGQTLLGRDLQCAQCHDHPSVGDYLQRHYYGISAFLSRSYLFTDPKSKVVSIGEKAEGDVKFTSVFTNEEDATSPRILDLDAIDDPTIEEEPYVVKPDNNNRGVPKYSRRLQLASELTSEANSAFRLNIANRIWALYMGRGIVEPLDMFHADNPPSHPHLLEELAQFLVDQNYDLRTLTREILLSKTYQQPSKRPSESQNSEPFVIAELKPLSPEQLGLCLLQATGVLQTIYEKHRVALTQGEDAIDETTAEFKTNLEAAVNKETAAHVDKVVTTFASANQSSRFDAAANQALFLLNSPLIQEWLDQPENLLIKKLKSAENVSEAIGHVYITVLSRNPSSDELDLASDLVREFDSEQVAGYQHIIRLLICSAEFRFNH